MLFNKKTALSLSSFILFSLVSACSSNIAPNAVALKGDTSFVNSNLVNRISENVTQSKQDLNHFFVDAGKGQKTGASFSVKLDFSNGGEFKTKASADGTASKIYSDMAKLKVALISSVASPTDLTDAVLIGSGPATTFNLTKTVGSSGGTTTVTFTNVPENSGARTYWIAAAALDSSDVNITNANGSLTDGVFGEFYVTNAGGGVDRLNTTGLLFDGDAVPSGSVRVEKDVVGGSTNYYVSSFTALTMPLQLKEATGASVGSTVTVTNGGDRVDTVITPS